MVPKLYRCFKPGRIFCLEIGLNIESRSSRQGLFFGLLTWLSLSFGVPETWAINASPEPIRLRQPDGTEVVLRVKGDPILNWFEDLEGRTVVHDRGSYVYAQLDAGGWLAPTRLRAGRDDPRSAGIRPGVFPTRAAVQAFRQRLLLQGMSGASTPGLSPGGAPPEAIAPVGSVKNLVVLCRFSDHDDTRIRAREDYEVVFNTVGGDPALAPTGSVRDYFTEASYGTVTLNSTVLAWVTLPNTEAYYGNGQNGTGSYPTNAQRMVYDALNLADPLVNFADFDTDNDGFVDAITIIHSGYAAETGGGAGNWIWSHKWSLWAVPGGRWSSADLNGGGANVKVYDYHTEAALWGTSGTGITRIGVICHETGHFFGLPDLYDTDGTSEGIGSYCLMANSWGFDFTQQHPPHFSAWCKQQLGWVTPTVITSGTYNAPRVAVTPTVFKVSSGYPSGEYLLIENRQPFGFESAMPQGGLCIWHIDENKSGNTQEGYPGQSGWPANGNHYKVALLQADGLYEMEKDMNRGNAGDVYRGGGVSQITPGTVPNTDKYQGGVVAVTNNSFTNISAAGNTMSFTYSQAALPIISSALSASAQAGVAFSYQITASNSPTSYGATGLPAGLSVNTATGLISGSTSVTGTHSVEIRASNAEGMGTATLTLTVTPPVLYSFNLDTDPGWDRQGEWAHGTPTGAGGTAHGRPDPTSAATGTKVFGINLGGDYSTAVGGPYYLTTQALNLSNSSGTTLRFKRWLNADYQPFTVQNVQVSNNGSTWTTVWQNATSEIADSAWTTVSYDLSAVADNQAAVYVRWGHQVGSGAWAYCGWNLDDVEILATSGKGLGVSVPATIVEGSAPVTGTVTTDQAPADDLQITLVSSASDRLSVPVSVVLPAGQTSVTFGLEALADTLLNGSPTVSVQASATGYASGLGTTRVMDDETTTLSVSLPPVVDEGLSGQTGTVSVLAAPAVDITIQLSSSNTGELTAPASLLLPAGQTQVSFNWSSVNDYSVDGDQEVQVKAEVLGWTSGVVEVLVRDVGIRDYFTEQFLGAVGLDFVDSAGQTFLLTPVQGISQYKCQRFQADNFPTNPVGGQTLSLTNDSSAPVALTGGAKVRLYRTEYDNLHVGSNGNVTLGSADSSVPGGLTHHFSLPRVAALSADLDPEAQGSVSWRQLSDRVAVTWLDVPVLGSTEGNSFQVELFFDGRIAITVLELAAEAGIMGLSDGQGLQADYTESDFSSYPMMKITLDLPAWVSEGSAAFEGRLMLDAAPDSDLTVALSSSLPEEAQVPAVVVVPAGEMEVVFAVSLPGDELLDGTRVCQITASAPTYPVARHDLLVVDDETAVISLELPATVKEGAAPVKGRVSLDGVAGRDVRLSLQVSSGPERLEFPAIVVIPAGESSVSFDLAAVQTDLLEGTCSVDVEATMEGWYSGFAQMEVLDDENKPVAVILPRELSEGDASEGRVVLPAPASENLSLSLMTVSSGRLLTTSEVWVLAGETEAVFDVVASTNDDSGDDVRVVVSTYADGLETGMSQMLVKDGTLAQLSFEPVATGQQAGVPFAITLKARDSQGRVIASFNETLPVLAEGDLPMPPAGTAAFVHGVFNGPVTVQGMGDEVVLSAKSAGVTGSSNPFQVTAGPLHHFRWEDVAALQTQDAPFTVTVTARDQFDHLVPGFQQTATLSTHHGGSPGPVKMLVHNGHADLEGSLPRTLQAISGHYRYFDASYSDEELLLPSQVDSAGDDLGDVPQPSLASALAGKDVFLVVAQPRANSMELADLGDAWSAELSAFVNDGGTLIVCSYEGDEHLIPVSAGLLSATKSGSLQASLPLLQAEAGPLTSGLPGTFPGARIAPWFDTDGTSVITQAANGRPVVSRWELGAGRVVMIATDFATPSADMDRLIANAVSWSKLEAGRLAMSPGSTAAFVNGSWTGQVRVKEAGEDVWLRAEAGPVMGESQAFTVQQAHAGPVLIAQNSGGEPLESSVSSVDFGSRQIGVSTSPMSLTLRNATPATTLTLGAMTITGPHAKDFTLDPTGLKGEIQGGESTTFTLTFTPRGPGIRTAQLSISSSSVVDQPLVLTLSGGGTVSAAPAQEIVVVEVLPRTVAEGAFDLDAFSSSGQPVSYQVLAGPVSVDAAGRVTPTGGSGAVTIRILQEGGGGYAAVEKRVTFAIGTWPRFVKVVSGQNCLATYALREDGTLWSWGYSNTTGYLADTTSYGRTGPTQVGSATTWTDLAMGNLHGLGRRSDGTMWAWGGNSSSQLGDNTTTSRTAPVQIGAARSWSKIAAGSNHSAAVAADGTLWTWGLNSSSQLGLNDTTTRTIPTQVGTATDWSRVACGGSFTVAMKTDGTLWAWGLNSVGQLGQGDLTTRNVPTQVGADTDWKAVAVGADYVLAQKQSGILWAWGSGTVGQLGTGGSSSQSVPQQVGTETSWVAFACGSFTSVARKADGSVWCWGSNSAGQLGDGTRTNRLVPQRFSAGTGWVDVASSNSAGHIVALKANGSLWVAGDGQGFTGLSPRSLTWAADSEGAQWLSLSGNGDHLMALRSDGTLWGWGYGGRGSFGNGSTSDLRVLTQIGTENQWEQVSAGSHFAFSNNTLAVKKNGTLWGAGANSSSALGDGTTTQRNTFVQIGTATNWKQAACGQSHGAAVRKDGTLWTWGLNSSGQLGLGDTTTRSSPVQVGTATDWQFVACGYSHTIAIKTNGTLWGFGANGSGQLGLGDTTTRTSPVQMGSDSNWQTAACGGHTLALKTNGTLWAWGTNSEGSLGLGDTVLRTTPTQVGTAANWSKIAAGRNGSVALKADGTLWTAGENHSGQMGDGSTTRRLFFTQLGTAGGFQHAAVGAQALAAIRADGSFWTAGTTGARVLGGGRSNVTVSAVQPTLSSQTLSPPQSSYAALQAPIRLFGTSGLPAQLKVLSGPATVVNGGLMPTGSGTVTVLAWQPGDERAWDAAAPAQFSFDISHSIQATLQAGADWLLSTNAFDASSAALNLELGFVPTPGQKVNLINLAGPGPVTGQFAGLPQGGWLILSYNGVSYGFRIDYNGGDGNDITLTHETPPQTIDLAEINPRATTDVPFFLGATASSGLPVACEVLTGPASVEGGMVTLSGQEGAVTLRLTQPGNAQFQPAEPLVRTFRVTSGLFRFNRVSAARFGHFTFGLTADNALWAWGAGSSGQLGDSGQVSRFAPVRVGTSNDWSKVAGGNAHAAGIRTDGTLWMWGSNFNGQIGNGTTTNVAAPLQISGTWSQVALGYAHTAAIKADGTLWTWGYNVYGQLGDGSTTQRTTPVQVGTATNWLAVACGYYHTLALKTDGTLWAWGNNTYGQLGVGNTVNASAPMQVGTATNWASMTAGGYHSLARRADGSLWAWGYNGWGSLGLGDTNNRTAPVQVGQAFDWVQVEAGYGFTMARKADESLWAWGLNTDCQLGTGDQLQRNAPFRLGGGAAVQSFSPGLQQVLILRKDSTLHVWGNAGGYHGLSARKLTRALPPAAWSAMSMSSNHALLLGQDGAAWGFGSGQSGQLGYSTPINSNLVQVGADTDWVQLSAGSFSSLGLRQDGTLWAWGSNSNGQLGDGTATQRTSPVQVGVDRDWLNVNIGASHSLGLKKNGTLWAWGFNTNGQLGDGTTTQRNSPVQIGVANDWAWVAPGTFHSLALKKDGTLWAWGWNSNGQLGDGTTTQRLSPVQVGSSNAWTAVVTNQTCSAALQQDGSLWTWGANGSGQLGLGDTSTRLAPTRVGTANDWTSVSVGSSHMAAIRAGGTLWAWGGNANGQLGDFAGNNQLSPIQIGTSASWSQVAAGLSCMAAMRSDGSVWTAGFTADFRLTSASGRSPFAVAPVLPGLQPQTLAVTPEGETAVRVTASSGLPVSLSLISGQADLNGGRIVCSGPPGSTVKVLAWQPGDDTAWDAALPVEVSLTSPAGRLRVLEGGLAGKEVVEGTGKVWFGPTSAEGALVRTFTLLNDGPGTLNLQEILAAPTPDWMISTPEDEVLAPGQSTTFQIAFQPQFSGTAMAWISIHSDDSEQPVFAFQVQGFGLFPQSIVYEPVPVQECGTPLWLDGLAVADSGLPVSYEIVAGLDVARIDGSELIFLKAGWVTVRALQTGNALYAPAASVSRTLQVQRGPQELEFDIGLPTSISHRATVSLVAASSRGLTPVTFSRVSGPGRIEDGSVLGFTGPGQVVVHADQSGDEAFLPATKQIIITATNATPVALSQSVVTLDSVPLQIVLAGTDGDGDSLSGIIVTPPLHGTLTGSLAVRSYVSDPGYSGPDSFSFKVGDGFAESEPVTVAIQVNPVAPKITQQPVPVVTNPGGRAVLSVVNTGSRPLQYQWWRGADLLEGQTASSLVLEPVKESDQASYHVVVSNIMGSVTSEPASLEVNDPVVFTTHPLSKVVSELDAVTLSTSATGTAPITYQWFHGTTLIPGATGREHVIPAIAAAQAGDYHVVATNPTGDFNGETATLEVIGSTPRITLQPQARLVRGGEDLFLEVEALGRPPLKYQWRQNGRPVTGATSPRLALYGLGLSQAGKYTVVVSTNSGSSESTVAEVGVVMNTPTRLTLPEKGNTVLKVQAAGNNLTCSWSRLGGVLPPAPRAVVSTDGRTLTFTKAESEDTGSYLCTVTGPGGSLTGGAMELNVFDLPPELEEEQDLPPGMVGASYSFTLRLVGGGEAAASSYQVTNLPAGLRLDSAKGIISGRPTKPETRTLKITAINKHGKDEVTADLEIRPFPERVAGTYVGLVERNKALNLDLGGRLDLVVSSQGSVSGKLVMGTFTSYPLSGFLDLDPDGTELPRLSLSIPRSGKPAPQPMALELPIDAEDEKFAPGARLFTDDTEAVVTGWRAHWHARDNPAAFQGFHTLPLKLASHVGDSDVPQGHGFGSFTLNPAGTTTITGRTADGEIFTSATPMGKEGELAVFSLIYLAPVRGSLMGALRVSHGLRTDIASDNRVDGDLGWSRPDKRPKGGVLYPAGFDLVQLHAAGGFYVKPPSPMNLPVGTDVSLLTFEGGGVEPSQTHPDAGIGLDSKGKLNPVPSNPGRLALKADAVKATFSGDFSLDDPHWLKPAPARWLRNKIPFQGMLIHRDGEYEGLGYFILPQLPVADPLKNPVPQLSGRVRWMPR